MTNGRTSARAPNGLTCTYDGTFKLKGGVPDARVVAMGKITVAADGTDIETHLEPGRWVRRADARHHQPRTCS